MARIAVWLFSWSPVSLEGDQFKGHHDESRMATLLILLLLQLGASQVKTKIVIVGSDNLIYIMS